MQDRWIRTAYLVTLAVCAALFIVYSHKTFKASQLAQPITNLNKCR